MKCTVQAAGASCGGWGGRKETVSMDTGRVAKGLRRKRSARARREKKVDSVWEGRGVGRLEIRICMEMGHICLLNLRPFSSL